jgi:hypothetical protein
MFSCRKCGEPCDSALTWLKRGDYICRPCRYAGQRARYAINNVGRQPKPRKPRHPGIRRQLGYYDIPEVRERERARGRRRAHDERERIKLSVRQKTRRAIRLGRFVRGHCVTCGTAKAVAHHPDYSLPWLIVWLCRPHHDRLHVQYRLGNVEEVSAIERLAVDYSVQTARSRIKGESR